MGFAEMNEAARVAHGELELLRSKMSPEQQQGAQAIVDWLKKHYLEAGYKRLCRPLVSSKR